jgi:heparan-alpha-glucosaminide N-acetyltransferase
METGDRERPWANHAPGTYIVPRVRKPKAVKDLGKPERLVSLDAYRGLVMVFLASTGFGIAAMAKRFIEAARDGDAGGPAVDPAVWQTVLDHFSHPLEWISQTGAIDGTLTGGLQVFCCSAWDMIQASFIFMVGVSMVYSYAKRAARGDSTLGTLAHVVTRSVVLVLLGVFLSSQSGTETNWTFTNVLCQIGLGYSFVYLLLNRRFAVQLIAGGVILIGYWLAFFLYPAPEPGFDYASRGVGQEMPKDHDGPTPLAAEWQMPEEPNPWCRPVDFSPWTKNVNVAADVDRWFLNRFLRAERFEFNGGGYATLNFVPSIFTMLLGAMAGQLLRGPRRPLGKFGLLVLGGAICLLLGASAGVTVCPVVKRIWTPSWALLAGGWSLWSLAAFYFVIDVLRIRFWTWPLVVVGMNSIAVYIMFQTIRNWTGRMLEIHLGDDYLPAWVMHQFSPELQLQLSQAGPYGPVVKATMTMLIFWLICVWLYRNKYFIRV